jgi:hypothetical protein
MGDESIGLFLLRAAVGGVVIYFTIRWLLVPRADFTVRVREDQVEFRGAFPIALRGAFIELIRELGLQRPTKIMGARHGARLRVWFGGGLTPGQKQRVRNFLQTRL